ncbi:GT2 family glycosyltransferase [Breznakia sp. PF5-3]|uniref:glycosyltransferase n=1 Tax=unclassified Breznakia TaxID=2623764 RepID=UPI002405524D|nr:MULTISPECIES: glycosyltransferase [unclassified Breznakia]MDF9824982.1 GT2 family glycosyltransferase [Breznakia sp. PM6-1]MDF9835825.1 GT2 family glycosyltransferase [Breznakia sp. PF5-3]MDF9836923.1 GT2 family glycosyltransferase [Breznakia sp. PFB2-8]MDF9859869.1 GT2 family glycosyltransferase [Breznakia sp. PH5-24]
MSKMKCDVIIPVYNAPDWTKLCVYALIKNTPIEYINKIYLMNDNSNQQTFNTLHNLKDKYGDCIEIITNEENLGFVKNCNKALKLSTAETALLLNSDCLVSKNTIPKLIRHMEKDSKIGLICPVASNAANLTYPIFEGFSYSEMDALLERKFSGKTFDACTIVGNCLMISKSCLDTVGLLDEIYGTGYGEETDYQFKAMEKGFHAKVAIDTYVFHKAEASFGVSKAKEERIKKNRDIFFGRWGAQYNQLAKEYAKNDPIKYIDNNLTNDDRKINVDSLIYLPVIVQNAGGCHVVVDLVNYLSINNISANILYDENIDYAEAMLFNPISVDKINDLNCKQMITTIWNSTFKAKWYADKKHVPLISFVQGYEVYFENGNEYGSVLLSYKLADYIFTISSYLHDKMKTIFDIDSTVIQNGVNYDVLFNKNNQNSAKRITMFMRGNPMKGDYLLLDLLYILNSKYTDIVINLVYINHKIVFPNLEENGNKINLIKGPISRMAMSEIMNNTDIYVDTSVNEGFGLLALEALCAGAVPIVSNSFGVNEYIKNGENGILINEVNDVNKYYEKISVLMSDNELFMNLKKSHHETAIQFDYDLVVDKICDYFSEEKAVQEKIKLSEYETDLLNDITKKLMIQPSNSLFKRFAFSIAKKTPQGLKNKMKKVVGALYNMYDHS